MISRDIREKTELTFQAVIAPLGQLLQVLPPSPGPLLR